MQGTEGWKGEHRGLKEDEMQRELSKKQEGRVQRPWGSLGAGKQRD